MKEGSKGGRRRKREKGGRDRWCVDGGKRERERERERERAREREHRR